LLLYLDLKLSLSVYGKNRDTTREVTAGGEVHNMEHHTIHFSPRVIKSRIMRWVGLVAGMG
jgi:hypothetical protein